MVQFFAIKGSLLGALEIINRIIFLFVGLCKKCVKTWVRFTIRNCFFFLKEKIFFRDDTCILFYLRLTCTCIAKPFEFLKWLWFLFHVFVWVLVVGFLRFLRRTRYLRHRNSHFADNNLVRYLLSFINRNAFTLHFHEGKIKHCDKDSVVTLINTRYNKLNRLVLQNLTKTRFSSQFKKKMIIGEIQNYIYM